MTATYIDMITGPAEQTQAEPYFVKLDDGSPKLGFIIPKNAEIGVSFENIEPGAHKVTVGLEYSPRELFPTDAICFEVSAR